METTNTQYTTEERILILSKRIDEQQSTIYEQGQRLRRLEALLSDFPKNRGVYDY